MPRSTAYYQPHDRVPVVDEILAQRVKHLIDAVPYLGYRMVWARLRMQGVVAKSQGGSGAHAAQRVAMPPPLAQALRARVESSPSVASVSNVRWASDATYVWTELEGLIYVNVVLDCADRECIGRNVSRRNDAKEAAWALEDAVLERFGALPTGEDIGITLRTDNALVYASELYRQLVKEYGLRQECILPHTPEQNGVVESFMGTLKLECIWQHRFKTFAEAKRNIEAWIDHYNRSRPHSRLGYLSPVEWRRRQSEISA